MTDDDPEHSIGADPKQQPPKREKLKPKYEPKVPQQDRPETGEGR